LVIFSLDVGLSPRITDMLQDFFFHSQLFGRNQIAGIILSGAFFPVKGNEKSCIQ